MRLTTTERFKLIGQPSEARLDLVVPEVIKNLVVAQAKKENINKSLWIKMAIVEKLERDVPELHVKD